LTADGLLTDRVTLVTGSSRGIGAAIALAFAAQGARVAVHGRDHAALAGTVDAIHDAGGQALAVTGDITDFEAIEAMRHDIETAWGVVEILVANAGGNPTPPAPLEDLPVEGWRATIDLNLTGTFLTLKAFLPAMKQRGGGVIITIGSTAGRRAHEKSPVPYAAAKAGIALLTQDVAAQAGPFGVRANCLAPETILTARNRAQIPNDLQATLAGMHPLRRLGTPDDVAQAAVFLASDHASWITGVVLDVSGGAYMA
jgi:3-oxoacyl-[acyl-carrier protein] reductase